MQPGQRRHAVGHHAQQQPGQHHPDGEARGAVPVGQQLRGQHTEGRTHHARAADRGPEEHRSRRPRPGQQQPRRHRRTDDRGRPEDDEQGPQHQRPQLDPARQQEVPAAGLLLAAGDPGGGHGGPHPGEDGEHRAGAPDGETAGVVERHRRPEQRPDGGALGQPDQRIGAEQGRHAPVLDDDDRRQHGTHDGGHGGAAAQQANGDSGDDRGDRRCRPFQRRCRRRPDAHAAISP